MSDVQIKNVTQNNIPESLKNDIESVAGYAYNHFLNTMKIDELTIRDIFYMAFSSGMINILNCDARFECIDGNCNGKCDKCEIARHIPLHSLASRIRSLTEATDTESDKFIL